MEGGLSRAQVAGIYVGREVVLIDSRNLVSEKGVVAEVVIDSGRPQINDGNLAPFLMDEPLRFDFRGTVRQNSIRAASFRQSNLRVGPLGARALSSRK